MMQVSASGEQASGNNMKVTIKALTDGSDWEGKFTADYAWRQVQLKHPCIFAWVKAKGHKDMRAEWVTAQNINNWFDGGKEFLIRHDLVKNEPGYICKYLCQLIFVV